MNSVSAIQFRTALKRRDDASALSLLRNCRIVIHSVYVFENDGIRESVPFIFLAVQFAREKLARALIRLGVKIGSFRHLKDGYLITPAGEAIREGNVPALSLCLRLGDNLLRVYRSMYSPPSICSGLEFAIGEGRQAALIFFLDKIYTARPTCLSRYELTALVAVASLGSHAKFCYAILASRGFNFKSLEEVISTQSGYRPNSAIPDGTSLADGMLAYAQKSGSADLLRYLVKDLGLVSTAGRMEGLKNIADRASVAVHSNGVPAPQADMTKYKCAACEFVGATDFCARCMVPRYCSTECQRSHWNTGGHKQECKEIQQRMTLNNVVRGGSSSTAGSSKS